MHERIFALVFVMMTTGKIEMVNRVCCVFCAGLKLISRCSQLSTLKLGICLNITDEGLIYIGNGCSKLIELDLYRYLLLMLTIILFACVVHLNIAIRSRYTYE